MLKTLGFKRFFKKLSTMSKKDVADIKDYNSNLQSTDLSVEALTFVHSEAEKRLLAIESAIENSKLKSKQFINYCSLVITALLTSLNISYQSSFIGIEFVDLIIPTCITIVIFTFAIWVCFKVLGESAYIGTLGRDPQNCFYKAKVKELELSRQEKFLLLRTTEQHQKSISKNMNVAISKADNLNKAYRLMRTGIIGYFILNAPYLLVIFANKAIGW